MSFAIFDYSHLPITTETVILRHMLQGNDILATLNNESDADYKLQDLKCYHGVIKFLFLRQLLIYAIKSLVCICNMLRALSYF